jgi:hypothetical protein
MNSGNPTLDKNLEQIEKYNPVLVKKILDLKCLTQDIQLIETDLKEPNLSYNGLELHSRSGAENEAKNIFNNYKNLISNKNLNVIFGLGLGYLFKEFAQNCQETVILYEPNPEILCLTLELVDFSEELSQKNIRIVSTLEKLEKMVISTWKYQYKINIFTIDSYMTLHKNELTETIEKLDLLNTKLTIDSNTLLKTGEDFLINTLENFSASLQIPPLKKLKDIYKDKTAVVVSAGPTIDLNIETIKKNKDNIIIFCVGQALKTLLKHGITPDFVNIAEVQDVSGQIKDFDLSNINLIFPHFANKSIYNLKSKQNFLFPPFNNPSTSYWSYFTEYDTSDYIIKGTVSYQAVESAKMLGCKKIILVGQDLAYLNNACYSKDSAYSDIIYNFNPETKKYEFKIENYENYAKHWLKSNENIENTDLKKMVNETIQDLNSKLFLVKGISGEMLPTQLDYAAFTEYFKEFAAINKDLELINTSMIGAQIDGFKNMPLEDALKNETPINKIELDTKFEYNKKTIIEKLQNEQKHFENILSYFHATEEPVNKIEKELKRRNIITENIYKYYNFLYEIYNYLTENCYNKDEFYLITMLKEGNKIQQYFNTTKDTGEQKLRKSYILFKNYFEQKSKLVKIIETIKLQIELIVQSL